VTAHRHVFMSDDGTRTLPHDVDEEPLRVLGSFVGRGQAPGGVTDLAGTISAAELADFPLVYVEGAIWEVFDDDDGGRCRAGGRLDAPLENADGTVTLHAEGYAKVLQTDGEARRIWQTKTISGEFVPQNSEPFTVNGDEQIEAKVEGEEIVLGWKRKTPFIRATGKSNLDTAANQGDVSVDLTVNGGGLKAGEWIHIGNEVRRVKNTYTPGSTTVPLKTKLDHHHDAGTRVQWQANDQPDYWENGVVAWYPTTEISRVAFSISKSRSFDGAKLIVYGGTGPSGITDELGELDLSSGGGTTFAENTIPAGYDALRIVLRTTKAANKAKMLRVRIFNLRVNDLAGNVDVYTTAEVVEDVANFNGGGDVTGIAASSTDAMPQDSNGRSSAQVLDDMALLDDRFWRVDADGSGGKEWWFKSWGARTWLVTNPNSRPEWQPLPRKNVAVVPFRYAQGGYQSEVRVRASPDPFPTESRSFNVPLQEPLPPLSIADAIGQNAADDYSVERHSCRVELTTVELSTSPGVSVSAGRVAEGDVLRFTLDGNREVRVTSREFDDEMVVVESMPGEGETGLPALDSILARRTLLLARGKRQAYASLHDFDLSDPLAPLDLEVDFVVTEQKSGGRRFDMIVDWSAVTEDEDGNGTAVDEYEIQARPVEIATGDPYDKYVGGGIRTVHLKPRRDDDPADDDIPTRVVFRDVPHPRDWAWQVRGQTTDVLHQKSIPTDWTEPALPADWAPNAPTASVLDIDQHRWHARWTGDDPTVDDDEGDPLLDRTVDLYKWRLYKGTVSAPNLVDHGETRSTHVTGRIKRPGTATFTFQVLAVDQDGNVSAVEDTTATKLAPPTPTAAPTVTIKNVDVEAGTREVVVSFYYTTTGGSGGTDLGSAGQYGDDDVDRFLVEAETADNSGFSTRVRKLDTKRIDYDGAVEYATVYKGVKKGRRFRARYRAADTRNHRSARSGWSS
jgi:hypothetical protein